MIDERFSSTEFEQLGLNTAEARERANMLADEVHREIHEVVSARLQDIVEKLNALGHNLRLERSLPGDISFPGDIDYKDRFADDQGQHHLRLRLAVNTVVSTGYAHMVDDN